ncbi:MAG: aminotransferase class IV [Pseudomonadota bacterium]
MTFWLNGAFSDETSAIHIDDRGFLLGDGIFETIFIREGLPVLFDDHHGRLKASLQDLGLATTLPQDMRSLLTGLAMKNDLGSENAAARITVTGGRSNRGLQRSAGPRPTVLMTIAPVLSPSANIQLHVSSYYRMTGAIASRYKTIGYMENILAKEAAQSAGFDDALLINQHGRIACASAANVFAIDQDGAVFTPSVEEGAMPGIVRAALIAGFSEHGIEIKECAVTPSQIENSELFLTNSLIGLAPASIKCRAKEASSRTFKILNAWYHSHIEADIMQRAQTQ